MTQIRRAQLWDLPAAYRVCLRTGAAGADATAQFADPDLLGHVYAGPYLVGEPHHAYVAVDEAGVAGYVLAVADTESFDRWTEREWWPALRERYPLPDGADAGLAPRDAALVRLLHRPETRDPEVLRRYPSHLHIDLLPRLQGQGMGRALIERALESLKSAGSRGVHLGVAPDNTNAVAFYEHLGMRRIDAPGGAVTLGLRFDSPAP